MIISNEMQGAIYFRTVDLNNNYSETSSIEIKIDKTSPEVNVNIVPEYTRGEVKYTNTNQVRLDIEATDNYSEAKNMEITLINEVDYDITNKNEEIEWIAYEEDKIWELTTGEGTRKVYVIVKDEAGNQSMYLAK